MSSAENRPWYFDLVKEVGGLGLVLIMLVGLYLLGDKYLASMKNTWDSIEEVTKADLKEAVLHREQVQKTVSEVVTVTHARMLEFDKRLSALEREQ